MQRTTTQAGGERWWFWCEGCDTHHAYTTKLGQGETGPCWQGPGDPTAPTFSPSLLCNGNTPAKDLHPHTTAHRCHLYVRNGQVQYLSDCSHHLAGRTVPISPARF